jgi:hypothetical protein
MPKGRQKDIYLSKWNLTLPALIVDGEGAYLPLKYLCGVLMGTVDDRPHRLKVKRDPILCELWRLAPFDTAGGQQELFCLLHVGLARWIDRIDLNKVRPEFRAGIKALMWDITLEANRLLTGEVESRALPMIVPPKPAQLTLRDEDVKRLLFALADRIGTIELSQREAQSILLALASGDLEDVKRRCPQCGFVFGED